MKKRIALVLSLTLAVFYTPLFLLNTAAVQKWVMEKYHPLAPWVIEWESLRINPFPLRVKIVNLQLHHPDGHAITVEQTAFRIKLWHIMKGHLAFDPMEIKTVRIDLAQTAHREKKEKKFSPTAILFLQNLIFRKTHVEDISVQLPAGDQLFLPKLDLELEPRFFGGTSLALTLQDLLWQKQDAEELQWAKIHLDVTTNLENWTNTFPYLNDIDGTLALQNVAESPWLFETMEAQIELKDSQLNVKKFLLQRGPDQVVGTFQSNIQNETFAINLQTPQPLELPELESEPRTFDIAGKLAFEIALNGRGWKLPSSEGSGIVKISHIFAASPDFPATAEIPLQWKNGAISTERGIVTTPGGEISAAGNFTFQPPTFNLKGETKEFPMERFFEKFDDKNLRPIHGSATAQATLTGFGKEIHLQLNGTALDGGYASVHTDKAVVDLDLTHEHLKLTGDIFTNEAKTGDATFQILYGAKQPGKPRPKKISLDAKVQKQDLAKLLPKLPITGLGNGNLILRGEPKHLDGKGTVRLTDGEFLGVSFEAVEAPIQLTEEKLVIPQTQLHLTQMDIDFKKPFTFFFVPGGFDLKGAPADNFSFDVSFHNQNQEWLIKKLDWKDPLQPNQFAQIQGSYTPDRVALQGKGNLDCHNLLFLGAIFQEGGGPLSFQLSTNGPLADLAGSGWIQFDQTSFGLRNSSLSLENVTGKISFDGKKVTTEKLTGLSNGGRFELAGWTTLERWIPRFYDVSFQANQLFYRNPDANFRMEYDADLHLVGNGSGQSAKGSINVLNGRYSKDFDLIEEIRAIPGTRQKQSMADPTRPPIHLDLKIRNIGDLAIDNNVGRIELATELKIGRTWQEPSVEGTIEVVEGKIHYLGVDFEITRGFMEFRDPNASPYLEVEGEKEIPNAHLQAKLFGSTDNLTMELTGTLDNGATIDRKDVISLLLFGVTTTERKQQAAFDKLAFGPEIVAEQVLNTIQQPVSKLTRLDVLRLEAKPTETGLAHSFHVGKRLSDRLQVEFASEFVKDNALQTFLLQYWLTDFLLFKGSRASEESYQLGVGVRFNAR